LSKYLGNFWFSLRPFITPGSLGISQSYFFISRYYLSNANDYFTLTLGSGFSPDDNVKDVALINSSTLKSKKVRLDVQKGIFSRTLVSGLIGYDRQEFQENTFRNNLSFNLGIQQLF
jgi:YaiO family outer membrane protein